MKRRTAVCPACGAPVEFQVGSSLVTICEFCNSAVARTDKKIEDFGKVADLVETQSRLRRGLTGRFSNKHFTIVGRVQYAHPAGGVWDEWYLAFPGDKWGWLSQAQGRNYLMFERQLSSSIRLPEFGSLSLGGQVRLGKAEFEVTEKGVATAAAAEGDIPWPFRQGAEHRFADLAGPDDTFATFEYGEKPHAYVGKQISLDDLDLAGEGWHIEEAKIAVAALQLNCPQCGGPLTLHAPDKTERVTCQSCNSLLDADNGKLKYFATIKHKESLEILIPLGSVGTFSGDKYTTIGFMRRFALYEGKTFPWSEYLLYNPELGFRWLVHNDRHWSFVEAVSPAAVKSNGSNFTTYENETFRIYDRGVAYVRSVMGEFYWRVKAGEEVRTADFIAPPRMISYEWSESGQSEEVNVSLGTYLTTDEIEKAFGLTGLPRPWGVGVIQPRPAVKSGVFLMWPGFLLLLIIIQAVFSTSDSKTGADPWLMFYGMIFVSAIPLGILGFWHAFEVQRWKDSDYSPYASSE